jgi:holin-like protein
MNARRTIAFLRGIAILAAFFYLGQFLHWIGVPIPGGVLGLIVFYLALSAGVVKLEWVDAASNFLLRNMVLLFVPLTVGLMDMVGLLSRQAIALTASLLVSLAAVVFTTGLLGEWLLPPHIDHAGPHPVEVGQQSAGQESAS